MIRDMLHCPKRGQNNVGNIGARNSMCGSERNYKNCWQKLITLSSMKMTHRHRSDRTLLHPAKLLGGRSKSLLSSPLHHRCMLIVVSSSDKRLRSVFVEKHTSHTTSPSHITMGWFKRSFQLPPLSLLYALIVVSSCDKCLR